MQFSLHKIINLISVTFIFAIPAPNLSIILTQENGLEFNAFIRGDEWNNWYETMDGYSIAKNNQNVWKYAIDVDGAQFKLSNRDAHLTPIKINVEKHLRPIPNMIPPNHAEENPIDLAQVTREEFEIPLVLIDYPNMPHSYPPSDFGDLMNQEGYAGSQGATGSFRDLYIENSYGQFLPNTTIIGWFTADEDYQNYDLAQEIRKIHCKLNDNEKKLIKMNFFEGKTHKIISRDLEIPLGTVKSRIRNILTKMRNL